MSPTSAADQDGMNGTLFQKCWSIIKHDLHEVINSFITCQMLSKYFSHSCIVLLPKLNNPKNLSEYRSISLSNLTSKVFS